MNPLKLTLVPYDCALPRPITTAHGKYERRSGLLLVVRDSTGACGLGDAAPLPGFSLETLDLATARARELGERLLPRVSETALIPDSFHQLSAGTAVWSNWFTDCPSLQFAWETALADLGAQRQRIPLAHWLNRRSAGVIAVNALLVGNDPLPLAEQARALAYQGYVTFKIKAGTSKVNRDIDSMVAVRSAVPGGQLRIDANGGWDQSQVAAALSAAREVRAEFVEQPLPIGYAATARRLARSARIPLALDEEANTFDSARHLIESDMCDVIVLKPMVVGGLVACMRLAALAHLRRIRVVYTSAWESDIGVAAALHLAAALGPGAPAAGLSTAGKIASDLVEHPLTITTGQLAIPDRPGLGMNLAPDLLRLQ